MAKTFRLQPLLQHKRRQEEQQTQALAALDAACRRTRAALEALRREEEAQLEQLATLGQQPHLDAEQYRTAISYLGRLEGSIALQTDALTAAEQRALDSRDALVAILKERRSLERLHERQAAEALTEEGRREARVIDDITSARYVRRSREGA